MGHVSLVFCNTVSRYNTLVFPVLAVGSWGTLNPASPTNETCLSLAQPQWRQAPYRTSTHSCHCSSTIAIVQHILLISYACLRALRYNYGTISNGKAKSGSGNCTDEHCQGARKRPSKRWACLGAFPWLESIVDWQDLPDLTMSIYF